MPVSDDQRRRQDRLRSQRITGGLLTTEGAAALSGVGFEPVCEVIGAVVNTVSPTGFYSSGHQPNTNEYRTFTGSGHSVAVGVPTALTALKSGYRTALARLQTEARTAGADGVVGLTLERTVTHADSVERWSFLAVGTAVRSTGRVHLDAPFTTDLGPAQTAAAVRSGWLPVSYLVVPCMAIRAVDPNSRRQRQRLSENGEVDAYTDLVNTCRHQARTDFQAAAAAVRADAAVQSGMTLALHRPTDATATAEVTITGTALARFQARPPRPGTLTIIPLRSLSRTSTNQSPGR